MKYFDVYLMLIDKKRFFFLQYHFIVISYYVIEIYYIQSVESILLDDLLI